MKRLKTIIRVLLFFIIGIILFFVVSPIFVPKTINEEKGYYRTIIQGFYKEPKNSLDVIFIGDSSVYRGISPIKMWEDYGFTSYDFASPAQKIWDSYYCIKEVLKYQKPKVIALHVDAVFNDYPMNKFNKSHLYDNMPYSINKIEAITDKVQKNDQEQTMNLLFPIFKFHSRWSELNENDFEYAHKQTMHYAKGYLMAKGRKAYKGDKEYMKIHKKKNAIGIKPIQYLIKIKELCQENDINLLLIENPAPNVWNQEKNQAVTIWANRHTTPFLDMNMKLEEIGIDWEKDTHDKGDHMNINGAEKISSYLGKYLKEQYGLIDHRSDESYEQWNLDTKIYEQAKQNVKREL